MTPLSLFACAYVCSWTLATVDAITCDSMGRSHRMIVQTLDDVTSVASRHPNVSHYVTQTACCAARCSMGTTALHSNRGGHGRSAPTLVTPLGTQQNLCVSHSASDAQNAVSRSKQRRQNALECTQLFSFHGCLFSPRAYAPQRSHAHSSRFLRSLFNFVTQRNKEIHIDEGKCCDACPIWSTCQ